MARAKKVEEKAEESATLQISLEDFVRTRDSVSRYSFHSILLPRDYVSPTQ